MSVPSVEPEERATDPGLVILYDVEAVHTALGQRDSPVVQGTSQHESVEAFKKYIFEVIMHTPCSDVDHGVLKSLATRTRQYYPELLQRMSADTYYRVISHLEDVFAVSNTPTADWSVQVSSVVGVPNSLPPHRPLGFLIKVQGGVGQGQVQMAGVVTGNLPEFTIVSWSI